MRGVVASVLLYRLVGSTAQTWADERGAVVFYSSTSSLPSLRAFFFKKICVITVCVFESGAGSACTALSSFACGAPIPVSRIVLCCVVIYVFDESS